MADTPRAHPSFEKANVEVIGRRDGLVLAAVAPLLVFQSVWMLTGALPLPLPTPYGLAVVLGLLLLPPFVFYAAARPKRSVARVEASEAGLVLDGRRVRPRSTIHSAFVRPLSDGRASVRLERRLGLSPLDVVVADETEARCLLRALGRDPSQATATFTALETRRSARRLMLVLGPILGLAAGAIAVLLVYLVWLGEHPPTLPRAVPLLLILFMAFYPSVLMRRERRFTVGADGVLIRGSQFISYSDIESASMQGFELVLALRSGETRRFYVGFKPKGALKLLAHDQTGDALLRRLEEARAAYVGGTMARASSLVARGARTTREWVAALRRIADPDGGAYRWPSLPREQLWRVVEDVQCTPEQRAGAAVALSRGLDEASRARLRVTAEACASPALRETLAAVEAERSDEDVEKALRRIG